MQSDKSLKKNKSQRIKMNLCLLIDRDIASY